MTEEKLEIYLEDLSREKQEEFLEFMGEREEEGNYENIPIAVFEK